MKEVITGTFAVLIGGALGWALTPEAWPLVARFVLGIGPAVIAWVLWILGQQTKSRKKYVAPKEDVDV